MSTSTRDPGVAATPETDAALQQALADAVQAYAARVREHGEFAPFPPGRELDSTDIAFTVAAMLKHSDIYSFEIAAMFNI